MAGRPRVVHRREPHDVFIGRPSKWGNPFVLGEHGNRQTVIRKYVGYLHSRPDLLLALPELRGKTLGCFCAPKPCHGDVLADLVELI